MRIQVIHTSVLLFIAILFFTSPRHCCTFTQSELNGELHQESKQEGDGEKRWRVGNWTGRTGRTEGTEWRGVTRRDFSSRGDGPEESLVRRGKRADARKSAYVCEEGSLELSCGAGKHIDVLRANFGRFSITLCNPSGFLDWSVNCASGNSLSVLTERCSGQSQCSVAASSYIFGDPCPTTSKYLEVHYRCSSALEINSNRNLTKSAVPLDNGKLGDNGGESSSERIASNKLGKELISLENSLQRSEIGTANHSSMDLTARTNRSFAVPPSDLNQDISHSKICDQQEGSWLCAQRVSPSSQPQVPVQSDPRSSLTTQAVDSIATPAPSDMSRVHLPEDHASASHVASSNGQWSGDEQRNVSATCESIIYRDMLWPRTAVGSTATLPCANGKAEWRCTADRSESGELNLAAWSDLPDLSQCGSRLLLGLFAFQEANSFRSDMWKSILYMVQQRSLYGADLLQLVALLEASLQGAFDQTTGIQVVNHSHQPLANFDLVFEIVSIMLSKESEPSWLDLPSTKRELAALNLMHVVSKFTVLYCLDRRHYSNEKETIGQSTHLIASCFSIPKLLHEFQSSWQTKQNISSEFKLKLLPSSTSDALSQVQVYMTLSVSNLQTVLDENTYFAVLLPASLDRYFRLANLDPSQVSLQLWDNLKHAVRFEPAPSEQAINAPLVRLLHFNDQQILDSPKDSNLLSSFEVVLRHFQSGTSLRHQCVHWDDKLNKWSKERCTTVQSNETHSTCRCPPVSICTVVATEHSANNWNLRLGKLSLRDLASYSNSLSLALVVYMWIGLLLIRCHDGYFHQSNFSLLLLLCLLRTSVELCLIASLLWPEPLGRACRSFIFAVVYQLQVIASLFSVFLFQNVILVVLANKIYLTKNYRNSLHAIRRSRQIQIMISFASPLIELTLLFVASKGYACWPHFAHSQIVDALFVTSPILQLAIVLMVGIMYLHCSQRIFSNYNYPSTECCEGNSSMMEKYVKSLYFARCKHSLMWSSVALLDVFAVVGCLCCSFLWRHASYALVGFDVCLSLVFLLFVRAKHASALIAKCNQSKSDHCHSSKELSSLTSIRDNSISILSDSSKAFLTLPGQVSLTKMLDSPKIYPSSHQSSTYGRNSSLSSHLYESPKHLFNYGHRFYSRDCSTPSGPLSPVMLVAGVPRSVATLHSGASTGIAFSSRAQMQTIHGYGTHFGLDCHNPFIS